MIVKWRLVPDDLAEVRSVGREHADLARSALLDGRLDEAQKHFETAARLREHPLDQVGIGDVHLARGRWREADEHYQRALLAGGVAALLAKLGIGQVMIGEGRAAGSIADLEHLVADQPEDPTLRYYLASAWYSVAEQSRSRTADDTLVITSEQQLLICEQAAERILSLKVGDEELERGAELPAQRGRAGPALDLVAGGDRGQPRRADRRIGTDHRRGRRPDGQPGAGGRRRRAGRPAAVRDRVALPPPDLAPPRRPRWPRRSPSSASEPKV